MGHAHAWRGIGIDPDDENIGLFRRKLQKPEMAGMDNVEVAGNERDGLIRAAGSANLPARGITMRKFDHMVQGSCLRPSRRPESPRGLTADCKSSVARSNIPANGTAGITRFPTQPLKKHGFLPNGRRYHGFGWLRPTHLDSGTIMRMPR
jgi:hypothetical protein